MTARNPTTFVVGAGPVATALAGALRLGGVPVLGLWARRPGPARQAGSAAGVAAFSSAPPDILLEAEVVIIAVRDQVIGEVAQVLVGTGLVNKRHVLLHCAGAASAREALGTGRRHGRRHRHVAASAVGDQRRRTAMRALKGTVFGVEGRRGRSRGGGQAGRRARRHRARARQLADGLVSRGGGARVELRGRGDRRRRGGARRRRHPHLRRPCRHSSHSPKVRCATSRSSGTTDGLTGPVSTRRRGDDSTSSRSACAASPS